MITYMIFQEQYEDLSMGKEPSFQQMMLGNSDMHTKKNEGGPLPDTIYKN